MRRPCDPSEISIDEKGRDRMKARQGGYPAKDKMDGDKWWKERATSKGQEHGGGRGEMQPGDKEEL